MKQKTNIFSILSTSYRTFSRGHAHTQTGMTLLDTVVGTSLMLVIFIGIAGAFQLSVQLVTNNKARAGAIALANQRMEFVRSLAYASVGTVGGVPAGLIPQSESIRFNGVNFTRRTYIEYGDDPKDGIAQADINNIPEDYKAVKVEVLWTAKQQTHHIILVTRVTPTAGLETNVPGGTLQILSINSIGAVLPNAAVSIVNASTSPAISINTFTDASGTATVLGAPAGTGYQIIVSNPGYSTAQTYSVTGANPSPNPGHLTVALNNTTAGTFAIDLLGSKTVNTWTQILSGTSSDPFNDFSKIATSSGITLSGGSAALSSGTTTGEIQSIPFTPSSLAAWGTFSWSDTQPASTSIKYRIYNTTGTSLIPDADIPGNTVGFTSGSVDLSGLSTSTYPSIRLDAVFSANSTSTPTPTLTLWSVTDTYGPLPLSNIAFNLKGAKTIGIGVLKYDNNFSTGAGASVGIPNLEWDSYTTSIGSATGYDIASACSPQPETLAPGAIMTSNFYLATHTANALLVDVRALGTGFLIPGATVNIARSGFSATSTTNVGGKSFFSGLSTVSTYTLTVFAPNHATSTTPSIDVTGTTRQSVTLN